jgi:excisionase family DNA binding protein
MDSLPSQLLTARQVAERLKIGTRTVWRWAASGRLPKPIRLVHGRITRWRAEEIDSFVAALAEQR